MWITLDSFFICYDQSNENHNNFNEHTNSKKLSVWLRFRFIEQTQFFRMLPFKCIAGDVDKAKYFYVHALYLLSEIFNEQQYSK